MNPLHTRGSGRRGRRRAVAAVVAAGLGLTALSGCATSSSGTVTLDFFQFKSEAVANFDQIIADFEELHPDINVVQNLVPDPDIAIRTLLVKDKVPDVLTLNGSGNFGQLAKAGVFHDFTGDPILDDINPAVQEILDALGTFQGEEVNALGFANNADGIIYNKEIFADNGIEVPQTWDELIAACETLEAAGVTPFYGTLRDAWTSMPAFNAIGAQLGGEDFYPDLREEGADVGPDSPVSFSKNYAETMEKLKTLYTFAQDDFLSKGYDDGNAAFANGESAMYLQGIWAINPIVAVNPDIDLSVFPYPASDDPEDTTLVSGVDVAITIGKGTPHFEEAMEFVNYLMSPEVIEPYSESQATFSPLKDAAPNANPYLTELVPYFDAGRITGFIDHQIPASIPLQPIVQQFLIDGNEKTALASLDNEWRKVAARTTTVGE